MTVPCTVVETALGWVGLAATDNGIIRSVLPMRTKEGVLHEMEIPTAVVDRLVEAPRNAVETLSAYLRGDPVDLSDVPLDLGDVNPFFRGVYEVLADIHRGNTLTYQEVARRVGNPRAARAVGGAVAKNPLAPFIPCHRVVGSDGSLVGFSTEGGIILKRRLLEMEGVRFLGDRVVS